MPTKIKHSATICAASLSSAGVTNIATMIRKVPATEVTLGSIPCAVPFGGRRPTVRKTLQGGYHSRQDLIDDGQRIYRCVLMKIGEQRNRAENRQDRHDTDDRDPAEKIFIQHFAPLQSSTEAFLACADKQMVSKALTAKLAANRDVLSRSSKPPGQKVRAHRLTVWKPLPCVWHHEVVHSSGK